MLAIIGGSGLSTIPELKIEHREVFRTTYGNPSSPLLFGSINQRQIIFLARHGFAHNYAPHEINSRANIAALVQAGASEILSISAVHSINQTINIGDIVLPIDLIDYTHSRKHTFFEGQNNNAQHLDFSHPYNDNLRQKIKYWCNQAKIQVVDNAIYSCLQGPRLPTQAEVKRYQLDQGDIYGMTAMPEAILAFEKNLAYAHLCGVVHSADIAINQEQDTPYSADAIEKIRNILSFI